MNAISKKEEEKKKSNKGQNFISKEYESFFNCNTNTNIKR
jgi:hypothetical protein